MSGMSSGSLQPTWFGHVTTARDALVLFEACLNGSLHHVPRRPHDRERSQLIKSGCVFIYEENASGIKRWTDGVPWSPSRILGNFLVYRELLKPFPPGEKKKAYKKVKRATKPGEPYPRSGSDGSNSSAAGASNSGVDSRENERALIGSLVDSYGFKEDGLVKKTMSVTVHGVQHHLVSYYKIQDALDGTLKPPSKDPRLANTEPRPDLIARQNFRAPLDELDDGSQDGVHPNGYYHPPYHGLPRPTLVMNTPSHAAQVTMGNMYSPMSYSSASHLQPTTYSYAPMTTPSLYSPPGLVPSPVLKHDESNMYGQGYGVTSAPGPKRSNSHSMPHGSPQYSYRGSPTGGLTPRSNSSVDASSPMSEHKPLNSPLWGRNANGVYAQAPGGASNPAASYPGGGSQWAMPASSHHTLPRPETSWDNTQTHWAMPNAPTTHANYHTATTTH